MNSVNNKIKVGIIGATGYVGAELARILLSHPYADIAALSSVSFDDTPISDIYPAFFNILDDKCTGQDEAIEKSDVIFAALPHGLSQELAEKCINKGKYFIDMGADFRLKDEIEYRQWYGCEFINQSLHDMAVYGLPELFRKDIIGKKLIANPGCYATAVPLSLAPAIANKIIDADTIIIDAKSGATGAGKGLAKNTHFPELNEGFSPYKVGEHRHTPEIEQTLKIISGENVSITFVPHLLPINRGIIATCYAKLTKNISLDEIIALYKEYYKDEIFVRVLNKGQTANLRNVKFSNYCDISIHKDEHTNRLITVGAIDNMVKGAAGQAIQNMNIICGFEETAGLTMAPPSF